MMMISRRWLWCALGACSLCSCASTRDLRGDEPMKTDLTPVRISNLEVTNGEVSRLDDYRGAVRSASMRAVSSVPNPSTVALDFTYLGPSDAVSQLASGQVQKQVGLKVRAPNTCNVLYVMWRAGAKQLDVSIKSNPGASTHAECRDRGYTRLRSRTNPDVLPKLDVGDKHSLVAHIDETKLTVRVDGVVAWSGPLPPAALQLAGPAGVRTDNVKVDFALYVRG